MAQKPKRSRHRIPVVSMHSDPITEEYQAEIDASMERLERRYHKAQKALAAAEAKAERVRRHAEQLAASQAEADRIAENRAAEEHRLSEYIQQIKEAAKNARIEQARRELEAKQRAAIACRDAETARRKSEAKQRREREQLIAATRAKFNVLELEVADRRREIKQIELLMMPDNYAGRNHRGTGIVAHRAGSR